MFSSRKPTSTSDTRARVACQGGERNSSPSSRPGWSTMPHGSFTTHHTSCAARAAGRLFEMGRHGTPQAALCIAPAYMDRCAQGVKTQCGRSSTTRGGGAGGQGHAASCRPEQKNESRRRARWPRLARAKRLGSGRRGPRRAPSPRSHTQPFFRRVGALNHQDFGPPKRRSRPAQFGASPTLPIRSNFRMSRRFEIAGLAHSRIWQTCPPPCQACSLRP